MGLGKTVQIASFLMAVFGKTGRRRVDVPAGRVRARYGYKGKQSDSVAGTGGCESSSPSGADAGSGLTRSDTAYTCSAVFICNYINSVN